MFSGSSVENAAEFRRTIIVQSSGCGGSLTIQQPAGLMAIRANGHPFVAKNKPCAAAKYICK
jgi:hypothetical protein